MTSETTYWLSMALIIFGSIAVGFILGGYAMVRAFASFDEDELAEEPVVDVDAYICKLCGKPIVAEIPKGLKGRFEHIACRRKDRSDSILDARYIG